MGGDRSLLPNVDRSLLPNIDCTPKEYLGCDLGIRENPRISS